MRQARQRSYSDGSTITERYGAPLSAACECCQCTEIELGESVVQYQVEIPQDPIYRPFTIETGIARNAEKPFGAGMSCRLFEAAEPASVQLGLRTHAVFAWQNKRLGMSHGKTCQAFGELFAISISRSTPARMCHRTGKLVWQRTRSSKRLFAIRRRWSLVKPAGELVE